MSYRSKILRAMVLLEEAMEDLADSISKTREEIDRAERMIECVNRKHLDAMKELLNRKEDLYWTIEEALTKILEKLAHLEKGVVVKGEGG